MLLVTGRGEYPYHKGRHLIAMALHAYGDDSGSQDGAPFTLILGYVASPHQWKLFRRDWNSALEILPPPKDGKQREFHAKEFFQKATWQSSESPYHGWKPQKAAALLTRLLDTIHRYQLQPVGGACKNRDFFAYSEIERRFLTGAVLLTRTRWHEDQFEVTQKLLAHESAPTRPYFVVFPGFLVEALLACRAAHDSQIHIYLDRKRESEARALATFNTFKDHADTDTDALNDLTFADSEKEPGLQAADLYAYVWNRKLCDNLNAELTRAFRVLTRKKADIRTADKRYFDDLLSKVKRDQANAIQRAYSEGPL